uniref:Uncharacterized protein n=1 Tax=Hordeum vulgare subsp. vulgare TaxID=112509 RepID=A0A8I6XJL8_HORVV
MLPIAPAPAPAPATAPTEDELNERARLVVEKLSSDPWICPVCQHVNKPIDNLLFKIPAFKCTNPTRNCNAKCPGTVAWSISDCILNTARTHFPIRNQGKHPTCTAHAILAGMDAALRIEGALRGKHVCQPLNDVDLLRKYCLSIPDGLGHEAEQRMKGPRFINLLWIAQAMGVEFVSPPGKRARRVLKLEYWFQLRIRTTSVDYLIRLIANGFPLIATMETGRCFRMVTEGELYRGPNIAKNHAVLLHGTVVRQMLLPNETTGQNELVQKVLFKARNSHGDKAHSSGAKAGLGGDVYILVEDLGPVVYGFRIEVPTWMVAA